MATLAGTNLRERLSAKTRWIIVWTSLGLNILTSILVMFSLSIGPPLSSGKTVGTKMTGTDVFGDVLVAIMLVLMYGSPICVSALSPKRYFALGFLSCAIPFLSAVCFYSHMPKADRDDALIAQGAVGLTILVLMVSPISIYRITMDKRQHRKLDDPAELMVDPGVWPPKPRDLEV